MTGEPVLGELVGTGLKLNVLPVVLTTWTDWLAEHPKTKVLSLETGHSRPYYPGAAYGDYFAFEDTMFPVWQRSDLLPTNARIFAMQIDSIPKAYPLATLIEEKVTNDTLGNLNLVIIATWGDIIVEGESYRTGRVTYTAGGEARAYERDDHIFSPGPDADTLLDEQGQPWQITEEHLLSPDGATLPRLPGHLAYWFGWYAFFPKTLVYGLNE